MTLEKEQMAPESPTIFGDLRLNKLLQDMDARKTAWQKTYWTNVSLLSGKAVGIYEGVVDRLEGTFPGSIRNCYVKDIEALAETSERDGRYCPVVSTETIESFEKGLEKGGENSLVAIADLREILFHEHGHIIYKERINEEIWDKWGPGFRMELDEAFAQWFGRHLGGSKYSTPATRFYFDINYPDQDPDTMYHAYGALKDRFGILPGEVKNPSLEEITNFLKDPKIKR
jgi:hypothetical protein